MILSLEAISFADKKSTTLSEELSRLFSLLILMISPYPEPSGFSYFASYGICHHQYCSGEWSYPRGNTTICHPRLGRW